MNSTSPSPPTVGEIFAQLFAAQTFPDWSTCTAVMCCKPPLVKPVSEGEMASPVLRPEGSG